LNLTSNTKSRIVTYLVIVLAAIGVFFAQKTGTTGGEIRHTEIRSSTSNSSTIEPSSEHDDD
jgi:hypothetical protein